MRAWAAKVIYLDNSATTQAFESAVQAAHNSAACDYFNPSAMYGGALAAQKQVDEARRAVAGLAGMAGAQVVFTAGGTEADNLAILGAFEAAGRRGHYVTAAAEHPAVLQCMQHIARQGGEVTFIPGRVTEESLAQAVRADTVLVSVMQVNNETGVVNDVAALARAAKGISPGLLFHSDAVQGYGRVPGAVEGVDMLSISGHKIHALKGVGALLLRPGVRIKPGVLGGGQEDGMRSGTHNTPGIAALHAAVQLWQKNGPEWRSGLLAMKECLAQRLEAAGARLALPGEAPHILSVQFPGVAAATLQQAAWDAGVAVGTGAACSSRGNRISASLLAQGVPREVARCTVRLSISPLNSMEEMHSAAAILQEIYHKLKIFSKR